MRFLSFLLPALIIAAPHVRTDFDGGSLDKVERVSDTHFRLSVKGETDQAGRNRQATWYFFRVDNAGRSEMIFDMVGLPGEYNFRPNQGAITDKTPPLISYDRKTWTHITPVEYDAKEPKLRLKIVPQKSTFWIAHTPPYTLDELSALRKDLLKHKDAREQVIGKTIGGRDIYVWSIHKGSPAKAVWLMFRQHSWESGSSWVGEGAVRALLSEEAESRGLREQIHWKIFPVADPEGVTRGGVRFNSKGYDLNRNWDVEDPMAMPEITAQRKAIAEWIKSGSKVELFLSLHNTETSEYLEGPPDESNPAIKQLAERFFGALTKDTTFHPSRPLFFAGRTTTEGMKGRMNVVQGLYRDFKVPAFLMEQRIAFNEKLKRLPTIEDRLQFGRELVQAIASALLK
ncbi:MAG TPA: M14-type cytosolic carboxypeptidase [Bryobacteraceae bacterium]|nr:M14-type cytosolic carboxypeptidase [Bryobacteraceae bacterium]